MVLSQVIHLRLSMNLLCLIKYKATTKGSWWFQDTGYIVKMQGKTIFR